MISTHRSPKLNGATKRPAAFALVALGFSAIVWTALAQNAYDSRPGGPGGQRPPPPIPPILAALDANRDGVIDAGEIENASAALRALDKNGDGKLTMNELMPPPPPPGDDVPGAAQGPNPGNPDGRPHFPPPPLSIPAHTLINALDTNHDGVIDAAEIAKAAEALKTLDLEGRGKLTMYELFRPPPRGGGPDDRGPAWPPPPPPDAGAANPAPNPPNPPALAGHPGVAVIFTGGYETDPRDRGRPVVLIAAALKVSSDVFRQAFSNVKPASDGREPELQQVRLNKETLLRSLGPYGITNDRLDTVSNYYRYNGRKGEMWRNVPATAYATIRNGIVTGVTVTNPGSGYSSAPQISIPGVANLKATAKLSFGTDFTKNGSIKEIALGD